jgi:hypothetical protein
MTIFSRSASRLIAPGEDALHLLGLEGGLGILGALVLERVDQPEPVAALRSDRQQLVEGDHGDEGDLVEDVVQVVGGDAELPGDLGVGGRAVELVLQVRVGLLDLPGLEPHRPRDPVDGAQFVDDRALMREIA